MLLIIDGNHLAHRCRHTFNLSNKGVDVSVTYGFLRMLATYTRRYKPDAIIVCWDGGIPEFRRHAVPEYKAGRHKDDDPLEWQDFLRQMDELYKILPVCGVLSVRHPGAEADDLMSQASQLSLEPSSILTADKDLLQCITDMVSVIKPGTSDDKIYTGETVQDEYGIRVDQIVDWRSIQGDGSDNIPGVYGIGEKTASALFQQFGNLSMILYKAKCKEYSGKLTEKIATALLEYIENINRNILVMHLKADRVGAKYAIYKALDNYQDFDSKAVKRYLMQNNFVSLIDGDFLGGLRGLSKPELIDRELVTIPMVVKRCTI